MTLSGYTNFYEMTKKFPGLSALVRTAESVKGRQIRGFDQIISEKIGKNAFFALLRPGRKKTPKKMLFFGRKPIVASIPLGRGLQLLH